MRRAITRGLVRGVVALGPAVAWAVVPQAASAGTIPSTPCISLSTHPHVVGGNNINPSNPGNPSSIDWLRGNGVRATFRVPLNPTVRHDCAGPASGIAVKLRMVNNTNDLTNVTIMVGVQWENHFNGNGAFVFEDPVWGVSYNNGEGDFWDSDLPPNNVTIGLCGLGNGLQVTLRIRNGTDAQGNHVWFAECKEPNSSNWHNMKFGGGAIGTAPNPYTKGISLVSRWRAGSSGGLNLDPTGLQYKGLTSGTWFDWANSDCFGNSTTDYAFDGSSSNFFSILAGTPNPNC